jgi:hypothetical protein
VSSLRAHAGSLLGRGSRDPPASSAKSGRSSLLLCSSAARARRRAPAPALTRAPILLYSPPCLLLSPSARDTCRACSCARSSAHSRPAELAPARPARPRSLCWLAPSPAAQLSSSAFPAFLWPNAPLCLRVLWFARPRAPLLGTFIAPPDPVLCRAPPWYSSSVHGRSSLFSSSPSRCRRVSPPQPSSVAPPCSPCARPTPLRRVSLSRHIRSSPPAFGRQWCSFPRCRTAPHAGLSSPPGLGVWTPGPPCSCSGLDRPSLLAWSPVFVAPDLLVLRSSPSMFGVCRDAVPAFYVQRENFASSRCHWCHMGLALGFAQLFES